VDNKVAGQFAEGSTVVRRDVLRSKIWTAAPFRVVEDSGDVLVLACWPGTEILSPTTWIEWLRTGDNTVRRQGILNLASGRWELARWTWRDTTLVTRSNANDCFSVYRFFDQSKAQSSWYINFERPFTRTRIGIDTFDLFLDLIVEPDLSGHTWKDEDEYEHGRRLGLIDDALHADVEESRLRVRGMVESRQGPFAGTWSSWEPDPNWPTPELPADVLSIPGPA